MMDKRKAEHGSWRYLADLDADPPLTTDLGVRGLTPLGRANLFQRLRRLRLVGQAGRRRAIRSVDLAGLGVGERLRASEARPPRTRAVQAACVGLNEDDDCADLEPRANTYGLGGNWSRPGAALSVLVSRGG